MIRQKREKGNMAGRKMKISSDFQTAALNTPDFDAERMRLQEAQRAVLNILEDADTEKSNLERTQKATFNILDDFDVERLRLLDTQRALLNILDDLNQSSEELQKAHDALEVRVLERTAELQQSNIRLQAEMDERKQAEEKIKASLLEKETMLKEIHHRVKNNLQVISSLLNMQSSYLKDEKAREALQESMVRVRTMAMIHTQLYQSQNLARIDFGLFVQDLIGNISQSYGRAVSPVAINVAASNISLGIDDSIPCGLILNELVANALKHAFPEGKEGEINIKILSESNQVVLTVQDNGIGFPESIDVTKIKTLGLDLVNLLVAQMNGEVEMQVNGGTTWTITFPIKNEREWRNG